MNKDNIVYLAIVVVSVIFVFGLSWVCGDSLRESENEYKPNENHEDDELNENQLSDNELNENEQNELNENEIELNENITESFQVDDYPRKEFLPGLPYERSGTFSRYVRQLG